MSRTVEHVAKSELRGVGLVAQPLQWCPDCRRPCTFPPPSLAEACQDGFSPCDWHESWPSSAREVRGDMATLAIYADGPRRRVGDLILHVTPNACLN
jgi:hypothetical protein